MLPVDNFIEFCMSTMCECLVNESNSEEECKCDSFLPYVEACEAKLGKPVRNWRIKHQCHTECPPGMEWNDCGPSCQLTCDSTSSDSLEECYEKCIPGCFCPPGTVLDEDLCVSPDKCSDKICQGFGDPHFRTFDGFFYSFRVEGSFLIVEDEEKELIVKGTSKKCERFTPITCLIELEISYKGHKVNIKKGKEIQIDGKKIPADKQIHHSNGVVILIYSGRTYVVNIPLINFEARYYEKNSGFAIKVPSRQYFDKTVGLCGNCNGRKEDEEKEELSEFVCSQELDGEKDECKKIFDEQPEVTKKVPLCEKLGDPIFEACHPLVDVDVYVEACNFDATHSGAYQASLCKTAMEYGRQCCQAGITIEDWPEELECDIDCPEGMQYKQCHHGCPQTCPATSEPSKSTRKTKVKTVANNTTESSCEHLKLDGCFCPEGKVMKDGDCVDEVLCATCDDEGHVPGDIWSQGNCKQCHCRADFGVECVLEVCPLAPICSGNEILAKEEEEDETSCCDNYVCVPKIRDCPPVVPPHCLTGETAKVHIGIDQCPHMKCECDPILCPDIVWPELEEGEKIVEVNRSCCPSIQVICDRDTCPDAPICKNGLELIEIEEKCCTTYKCKPPKDVCVYTHTYEVIDGVQSLVEQEDAEPSFYEAGEEWEDGLCEKCTCVQRKGQLVPLCIMEQCPPLEAMPESQEYVLQQYNIPGKCCPDIFRTQCKDDDGNAYEPGDQWQDEDNPCVTYFCEMAGVGDVRKMKSVINCTECPRTAVFIPPSKVLGQCCGICRETKCEDGDQLYSVGDTWNSENDPCVKAECVNKFEKMKIVYSKQLCATIPKECPEDKIIWDENGCCKTCNLTTELHCSTAPIPEEDTLGFFTYNDMLHGGVCVNKRTVPGVLQCTGACHSRAYYSLEDGDFREMCQCCKVNVTVQRTIELLCPDGNYIRQQFLQPESCQCSKCAPKTGGSNQFPGKNSETTQSWTNVQIPLNQNERFVEQKSDSDEEPFRQIQQFENNQVQQEEQYDY